MKVLAIIDVATSAHLDDMRPKLADELRGSSALFSAGVLREAYATAVANGIVFVLEAEDAARAEAHRRAPRVPPRGEPPPAGAARRSASSLQRCAAPRLAAKGRLVGRRALEQLAGLVTPGTSCTGTASYAKKYDRRPLNDKAVAPRHGHVAATLRQFATENPSWG